MGQNSLMQNDTWDRNDTPDRSDSQDRSDTSDRNDNPDRPIIGVLRLVFERLLSLQRRLAYGNYRLESQQ